MPVKSVQAPVGGINRLASIDDMPEQDAYALDNWIADAGFCRLRGGSETLVNVSSEPVETLMTFGDKLIAATDNKLIDTGLAPSAGSLPIIGTPSDIATGFTNDRWQWEVINNKLLMVNGEDAPREYDGTLSTITFTSGVTNEEELIGIGSFKGRAFYWKEDEAGFYYAAAGSYAGALSYYDLSPFVSKKSNLKLFFRWSVDSGDGPDDLAVFIMDTGEALVYQGDDPGDSDFWAIIGRYSMGRPLSIRSSTSIAGDRFILTQEGWQNFKVIWETGDWRDDGLGRKIVGLAVQEASAFRSVWGWEAHFFAEERLLLVNIPKGSSVSSQHALSTNTLGWSTFSGWNAATFGEFNGQIFFGDYEGNIVVAMYKSDDDGQPITTDAVPAFNYLRGRANTKQLTGIRPVTSIATPSNIGLEAAADYLIPNAPDAGYEPVTVTATPWGSAWGSPWSTSSDSQAEGEWQSANAQGYSISYRMKTTTSGEEVKWYSSQLMFRDGGWL